MADLKRIDVESVTDESGTAYCVRLVVGREVLRSKWTRRSSAEKLARTLREAFHSSADDSVVPASHAYGAALMTAGLQSGDVDTFKAIARLAGFPVDSGNASVDAPPTAQEAAACTCATGLDWPCEYCNANCETFDEPETADDVQPSELIAECWVPMLGDQADLESIVWADEDCRALATGWEWVRARLITVGVNASPALSAREVELLREIRVNFNSRDKLSADWRNEARNLLLRIEQGAAGVQEGRNG
jgi:hypothetical protein